MAGKKSAPRGDRIARDPNVSALADDASEVATDTRELRRKWQLGILTIGTRRTQAAMGLMGGKIDFPDVEINAATHNATVAVQSLEGKAIRESHAILISLAARSISTAGNRMPFHSEPVEGRLTIRAPEGLKLYTSNRITEKSAGMLHAATHGQQRLIRMRGSPAIIQKRPISNNALEEVGALAVSHVKGVSKTICAPPQTQWIPTWR
jgi:hypothetical protein